VERTSLQRMPIDTKCVNEIVQKAIDQYLDTQRDYELVFCVNSRSLAQLNSVVQDKRSMLNMRGVRSCHVPCFSLRGIEY
jgi:thiamine monophosphate kinase